MTARLLAASLMLLPSTALAQSAPVELTWDAPPGCSSEADVQARIRKLLGSARPVAGELRAAATVTRQDDGAWHLRLQVRAGQLVGERNIEGQTCENLAGVTAVSLALLLTSEEPLSAEALGGKGSSSDSSSSPSDSTPAPPVPVPQKPEPAPDGNDPKPPRRVHAFLGVPVMSVGVGPVPGLSLGGGLAAGVGLDRWRWSLQAEAWLPRSLQAAAAPSAYARLQRFDLRAWTCRASLSLGQVQILPCLTVSLQHVSARGEGANVTPRSASATWAGVGLGVQARYALAPKLALLLGAGAELELSRPQVFIENIGTIARLGPAAGTLSLGAEWIL
jgi:hypothetical protein